MKQILSLLVVFYSAVTLAKNPVIGPAIVYQSGVRTELVAQINVDLDAKVIEVKTWRDICGTMLPAKPGTVHCMAMPVPSRTYTVLLTSVGSSCGSAVYSGLEDKTMVDGARIEITVQDNSTRTCRDIRNATVESNITVYSPWTNQTETLILLTNPRAGI